MPFQFHEPDSPFGMLMAGAQGYGNIQDILQKSRMNPLMLQKQQIENALEEYKRQYAPLTLQSDAASKLAYANLMGPQFMAKLMGNTDILANIPEDQRQDALKSLIKAGMSPTLPRNPFQNNLQENDGNYLENNPFVQKILQSQLSKENAQENILGEEIIKPDLSKLPPEIQKRANDMTPGSGETYVIPEYNQQISEKKPPNFAETAATYKGIQKEGEEAGKYRAEDMQVMGDQLEASQNLGDKFNYLTDLINNPVFRNMRTDMPFYQAEQLWMKSKTGTPYEQELVGSFRNTADEFVRDTINSFSGTKLKGELEISKNMKVADNDSFNVIVGKVKSAFAYQKLKSERANIAYNLMEEKHMSKRQALNIADKILNTDKVIANINKKLDYPIQVRNKKTGKIESIPVSEARRRGIPNV